VTCRGDVRTGLDQLVDEGFARLNGMRVAILTNSAGVDRHLRHLLTLLMDCQTFELVRVFAPEHGLFADAQDQIPIQRAGSESDLSVLTLYGDTFASCWPSSDDLDGLDIIVADLPDIGSRYYTFFNTLAFTLERAAEVGVKVMVLDRPNPIGGIHTEGALLQPVMQSFVGYYPIPARHGLTLGELALLVNTHHGIDADLEVVPASGWKRQQLLDETGLPWVMPSPNMPTLTTALVYPGACLIEGTNLSEGCGTTRPFELVGAPFLDSDRLADHMNQLGIPGAGFRSVTFQPMFHKFSGQTCHGVQVHILDRDRFRSWFTYLMLIQHIFTSYPEFSWRTETYEFVSDRPAIDLLLGDPALRAALEEGREPTFFENYAVDDREQFDELRHEVALYPWE